MIRVLKARSKIIKKIIIPDLLCRNFRQSKWSLTAVVFSGGRRSFYKLLEN